MSGLIVRLQRTAALAPALREELAKAGQHPTGVLFAAPNPVLAAANLQAEVKRIAETNGVQLRSVQPLPSIRQEAIEQIGVRAEMEANTVQIAHILYDFEAHMPILTVRSLSVRGTEQPVPASGQRPALFIQLELVGFTRIAE